MISSFIQNDIQQAIQGLQDSGAWPKFELVGVEVMKPHDSKHGDFSTNVAMKLAGLVGKHPIAIAEELAAALASKYDSVKAVHPGFVNFFVSSLQLSQSVQALLAEGDQFGRSTAGKGKKVLLEFISANPTGPLTLPNGRGGYLGDVLANVLAYRGYSVQREYYVNDRGNQIDLLGESVARRYLQTQGINVPYADNLYQGEYINELADQLELKDYKLTNIKKIAWVKDRIKEKALELMLAEIQRVVKEKMQINFDQWFSERALYASGLVETVMKKLQAAGMVYEHEGALWVRTTTFGDDKDRVAVKNTGEGSYLQGDMALFYERAVKRKYHKVILVLGADHHGYEKRMKAMPQLLGVKTSIDLIFTQLATLMKDGKEVRMSKRKGNFVTIEELIDEVGNDVARFFFLLYSHDRHMNFDLGVATEKSDNNPVYYVQYAHARMCSIVREVEERGTPSTPDVLLLEHDAAKALVKQLLEFPPLLAHIEESYEVHHLTTYAIELARAFHHFYAHCRVIDNEVINPSYYTMVLATRQVLAQTLTLIGVSVPEKM